VVVGFFAARWALDGGGGEPGIRSGGSGSYFVSASLSEAVAMSDGVVVARVLGEPQENTVESGPLTSEQEDVLVSVERYLKGSGPDTLTITQTVGYMGTFRDGSQDRAAAEGAAELVKGHTYVLFLRRGTPGHWVPFGELAGFEVRGQDLLATGEISPADYGLSSLDNLIQEVGVMVAKEAEPGPLSPPDNSAAD